MSSTIHFLLRKTLLQQSRSSIKVHGFSFLQKSRKHTLEASNLGDPQSFTVSYLRNSCGLSSESAILASQKLQLKTTDQPDSVVKLLKSAGLDQTHITNLITKRPKILVADANKTIKPNVDAFGSLGLSATKLGDVLKSYPRILETEVPSVIEVLQDYGFTGRQILNMTIKFPKLFQMSAPEIVKPKLEYFKSLGIPAADIANIFSVAPYILKTSLKNQIVPLVDGIMRIVGSDDNLLKILKGCYVILKTNMEKVLEPNVTILMNRGVSQSNIAKLIILFPRALMQQPARFLEAVEEVDRLGFNPTHLQYVLAVRSIAILSKSVWEEKWETFRSFGMSEDEVISAFKLDPMCMSLSGKKISTMMEFYTNKLKLKTSLISKQPRLLKHSLGDRIIPRCAVLQLLMEKGLVKGNFDLVSVLTMPEKRFSQKYVDYYLNVVPEVIHARQGKMQFTGFPH